MEPHHPVQHLSSRARFEPAKPTKLDCFRSSRLFVGLNCLNAGQTQPVHVHSGADKVYFVVSGNARFVLLVAIAPAPHG